MTTASAPRSAPGQQAERPQTGGLAAQRLGRSHESPGQHSGPRPEQRHAARPNQPNQPKQPEPREQNKPPEEQPERCGPRWLGTDEQRVWRSYVHATMLLDDHLDRQLQRDAGMPHVYYGLLVQLAEAPRRRMRMTELAMQAKITRSRLSHAIARLERSGWVRREDCASDRRGQFAVLTNQGHRVLERAAPGHVEAVRQAVFDRLSPEQQRALGEIMQAIAEGLQPREAGADLPWLR